jgi:hypothetical protein
MVLELMEDSMRTPLTPTSERRGRPEHAGRGHVGIFWVVHARRVWRKLQCLNPSPTAYPGAPTEGGHQRWDQRLRVFLVLTLVSIDADVPFLRGE